MTYKIPAYPEIRFNETFKTIGSESYQAAFERIEEAIVRKLPKHLLLQIFPKQKNGHHPQGGAHFLFDSFG